MFFVDGRVYKYASCGGVTEKAIFEISKIINIYQDVEDEDLILGGTALVTERGTIAKRAKNNIYKAAKVKMEGYHVAEIGNIAHNNNIPAGYYFFSISSDMDIWGRDSSNRVLITNDDTGNSSCFRPDGSMHYQWERMQSDEDYFCIRVYDAMQPDTPIARAWAMLSKKELFVFNAYGMHLNALTSMVASSLNMYAREARLSKSDIFVNNERVNVVTPEYSVNYRANLTLVGDYCGRCERWYTDDDLCECRSSRVSATAGGWLADDWSVTDNNSRSYRVDYNEPDITLYPRSLDRVLYIDDAGYVRIREE